MESGALGRDPDLCPTNGTVFPDSRRHPHCLRGTFTSRCPPTGLRTSISRAWGAGEVQQGRRRACPTPPCLSFPFAPPTHSSQQIAATPAPDQPLLTGPGAPGALNRGPQAQPAQRRPPRDSPLRRPNADPPTAAPAHRGAARLRPRRMRGRSRLPLGFILRRRVNYPGGLGEK